ncbi:uncharacterized protein LOC119693664 [Plutella xylostella]|uniref:uncharacterized protein LOC119693664 n=1 Tax=Plutella xylostella TaxID=51655 RepID=UPI0020324601|nr:uncharacterized protein LOC119693664 [Plutella xylostella]
MTNRNVLEKTRSCSITAILKQRRLRWLGHVHRMDSGRLPRQVMLGQIADTKRPTSSRTPPGHLQVPSCRGHLQDTCEDVACSILRDISTNFGRELWAARSTSWRNNPEDISKLELEELADDAEERYNERSQLEGQYYELVSQARTLLEGQLDPAHNQVTDANIKLLPRYQRVEQIRQHFWNRFSNEYLSLLQQKTKWHRSSPEQLMEGTLVLVKDRTMPPLLWPLGRIIKVHPGTDGITRVVDVLTKKGTIQRAYNNICPLPTS